MRENTCVSTCVRSFMEELKHRFLKYKHNYEENVNLISSTILFGIIRVKLIYLTVPKFFRYKNDCIVTEV